MGCLSRLIGTTIGFVLLALGFAGLISESVGPGIGMMLLGLLFLAASPKEKLVLVEPNRHRSFALTTPENSQPVTPRSAMRSLGKAVILAIAIVIMLFGAAAIAADIPNAVGWTVIAIGFVVLCFGVSIDPHAIRGSGVARGADDEFESATEKQLQFAKRLGIDVPVGMGKWELSAAINQALEKNPEARQRHETINRKRMEREIGVEAMRDMEKWNNIADEQQFILAIYETRGDKVVDVLNVHEADFVKKNVVLHVAAPKITKMEGIRMLDFDRDFNLRLSDLLYHELLHPGFGRIIGDFREYEAAVKRGIKIAKRL